MSNLVPEMRPDKNNRIVKRYVRNGDAPWTAAPAPMPAPVTYGRTNALRLRQEVRDVVTDHDESGLMDTTYAQFFSQGLTLINEETAEVIKDFVNSRQRAELVMHLVADFYKDQANIREVICYSDALKLVSEPCDPGTNHADDVIGQIRGVRRMKEFEGAEDLSKLPPEQQREVSALLRVGYAVYEHMGKDHPVLDPACKYSVGSSYPLTIVDGDLVEFVKANADRAESISDLIRERKSIDTGWIAEALLIAPAITEGSL